VNGPLNSFHLQCLRESEIGIERTASRFAHGLRVEGKETPPQTSGGIFTERESARSNVTAESTNVQL
jgi:hypothetical protein